VNKAGKATVEVARKRKAEEADLQTWKRKKVDLQDKIAASEAFSRSQENVAQEANTIFVCRISCSMELEGCMACRATGINAYISRVIRITVFMLESRNLPRMGRAIAFFIFWKDFDL